MNDNNSLPLTNEFYNFGFVSPTGNQQVSFTLRGVSCNGTIYDGSSCVGYQLLNTGSFNATYNGATPVMFKLNVAPTSGGALPKNLTVTVSNDQEITTCLSYQSSPYIGRTGSCTNTATVLWPSIGDWYISFEGTKAANFTIQTTLDHCENNNFCNTTVTPATSLSSFLTPTINALSWAYYRYSAQYPSASNTFWVTVAGPGLEVYVSLNQFPTKNSYDIKNCNQLNCGYASILNLNTTTSLKPGNYTFFVGIYNTANNTASYGIWFNSICAPGCTDNSYGTCNDNGPSTGQCVCASQDYAGYNCQTLVDNGIPAQYIVLIIIASLVVASAIIGFIAWAYMQKKRQGYVKVKD
jgi:hypothetical protein